MKYQPYKGYGHKPWLSHGYGYCFRVKTKSDWRYPYYASEHHISHEVHPVWDEHQKRRLVYTPPSHCKACGKVHCYRCGCQHFWKKWGNSKSSVYEKQVVHHAFRVQARDAIRRELMGDDGVSHNFFISGDWLD